MKWLAACLLGCLLAASSMADKDSKEEPGFVHSEHHQMEQSPNCPSMPMCADDCQLGYKLDQKGCMTCECKNTCGSHMCPEGAECHPDPTPTCSVIPLCRRTQTQHSLECDHQGTFRPTQCRSPQGALLRECWCVNDRGLETEGSRTRVHKEEAQPQCAYNRTVRVHVQFYMRHDVDQVEVHLGRIRETVHHHITEWMLVDREYVINLKVEPHTHRAQLLVVKFEVVRYGRIDLAATVVHLQDHMKHGRCHVLYQGHKMDPDPSSLHTHHTYGPEMEPPVHHGWSRRCHRIFYLVAPVVGGVIFLLTVICVVALVRKRVQRKHMRALAGKGEYFKQNIAFSNDFYDEVHANGDIKKVKLEFSTEPVVEAKLTTDA